MPLLPLLTGTVFLAALLLFIVQPMVGKMLLPLLGGSPSIWNTCMVFFQAVLLAGYAYAHGLSRLSGRAQAVVHAAVLLIPAIVLPVAIPRDAAPPADGGYAMWLLLTLAVTAGLPVFAVASAAPLIQRWFASTDHPAARDPYFLYAASNAGSLLALLAYPFLVEPSATLRGQSLAWAGLYGAFVLCTLLSLRGMLRARGAGADAAAGALSGPDGAAARTPTTGDRLLWLVLAAAPSSLLLGTTTFISTDIAAAPLLWVLPLAAYLLTFINAFARRPLIPTGFAVVLLPAAVLAAAVMLAFRPPVWSVVLVHLIALTAAGLACHGRLAERRPHPKHLTEFYLLIAMGGVLGGAFNTFVAPVMFTHVLEYPLVLAATCVLAAAGWRPRRGGTGASGPSREWRTMVRLGYAAVVAGAALTVWMKSLDRPDRRTIYTDRTFFGVHRVVTDLQERSRALLHGTTIHGVQPTHPDLSWRPTSYYHYSGPLGLLFRDLYTTRMPRNIGVVGLGIGSVAAYGLNGQRMVFFELDPAVAEIAATPSLFTYLSSSEADVKIVLGDGRLGLRTVPDGTFDVLILDAFSSDAIPVHLLTREAVREYVRVLAPGGVMALHISNRYFNLAPLVDSLARAEGLEMVFADDGKRTPEEVATGKFASVWAVLARTPEDLAFLAPHEMWTRFPKPTGVHAWTDDYSDLLGLLRWRPPSKE